MKKISTQPFMATTTPRRRAPAVRGSLRGGLGEGGLGDAGVTYTHLLVGTAGLASSQINPRNAGGVPLTPIIPIQVLRAQIATTLTRAGISHTMTRPRRVRDRCGTIHLRASRPPSRRYFCEASPKT